MAPESSSTGPSGIAPTVTSLLYDNQKALLLLALDDGEVQCYDMQEYNVGNEQRTPDYCFEHHQGPVNKIVADFPRGRGESCF